MKDIPIIFSAPMIQAILREITEPRTGKIETRRILKPQPHIDVMGNLCVGKWNYGQTVEGLPCFRNTTFIKAVRIPSVGDRLWTRETHWQWGFWDYQPCRDQKWKFFRDKSRGPWFMYEGDQADGYVPPKRSPGRLAWYRRPSIYMPLEASRLTLIVEDVRIERLQEISDEAALREGIRLMSTDKDGMQHFGFDGDRSGVHPRRAAWAFQRLWESINGPETWTSNPWVVAIRFRPHLINIEKMVA